MEGRCRGNRQSLCRGWHLRNCRWREGSNGNGPRQPAQSLRRGPIHYKTAALYPQSRDRVERSWTCQRQMLRRGTRCREEYGAAGHWLLQRRIREGWRRVEVSVTLREPRIMSRKGRLVTVILRAFRA